MWVQVPRYLNVNCMSCRKIIYLKQNRTWQLFRGAWIAEWCHTHILTLVYFTLGREFMPRWGQTLFWLEYNINTAKLTEEDKIKRWNTINTVIIVKLFENLCCLWKFVGKSWKWEPRYQLQRAIIDVIVFPDKAFNNCMLNMCSKQVLHN